MSTTAIDVAATARSARRPLPAWLREPLLHFAVLGALLFGVDHLVAGRDEDPRVARRRAEQDRRAGASGVDRCEEEIRLPHLQTLVSQDARPQAPGGQVRRLQDDAVRRVAR